MQNDAEAESAPPTSRQPGLRRELGVGAATMLGLGSILGTGVFVSLGLAAGSAGPAVVLAVLIAACVALCNAISSAQLAANHPVSGGTYEYGYTYLTPTFGFTAGWMFLLAKSASAATAALGLAGYIGTAVHLNHIAEIGLGVAMVLAITGLILSGLRRTNMVNIVIVSITILTLAAFAIVGFATAFDIDAFRPFFTAMHADVTINGRTRGHAYTTDSGWHAFAGLMNASALAFVAYTGYGRIATLGEEVRDPRKTIPKAIVSTLGVSLLLYLAVVAVAVGAVGADSFYKMTRSSAAPLEAISRGFGVPGLSYLMLVGAVTAMAGVLLNLVLGLSRVLLAMGRRRDAPSGLARVTESTATPSAAVIVVGVLIALLVLIGDVGVTWSFSAFTVLVYYAITNLCALRLPPEQRMYPRIFPVLGLIGCLGLAFWVDWQIWLAGLSLIALGLLWHFIARRLAGWSHGAQDA